MPPSTRPTAAPAATPTPNAAPASGPAEAPAEPRTLQVVATRTGFYADIRRRVDDQFPLTLRPGQKLPSWVRELGDPQTAPVAAAAEPASPAAGSGAASTASVL
jgi:hypothetical protein